MLHSRENYYEIDEKTIASLTRAVIMKMVFALLITFGTAFTIMNNYDIAVMVVRNFNVIIVAQLITVFVISWAINKISLNVARGLFLLYSVMMGATISILLLVSAPATIIYALAITVGIFTVMAVYGYVTNEDLSKFKSLLTIGLICLIIVSVVNIFVASSALYWIISYAGVLIFTAFVGYDMQKIKRNLIVYANGDSETLGKVSLLGALELYLDFVNLFIYILRILNGGKRR